MITKVRGIVGVVERVKVKVRVVVVEGMVEERVEEREGRGDREERENRLDQLF